MFDASVARHELGHVLALIHYGHRWDWVSLDAVSGRGWCCFATDTIPPFERCVIALAGSIAQARYLRREIPVAPDDHRIAQAALDSLPDDSDVDGAEVVRRATAIVDRHWAAIERGARALMAAGHLTCEEVERLFRATPAAGEWRSPRFD
jgi:hypothetical protein